LEIEWEYSSFVNSPTITKPPVPEAMADNFNGDGLDDLIVANYGGDPSKVHAVTGKSYVVFGKQGTDAIELSIR
jgi:hypothetical protein